MSNEDGDMNLLWFPVHVIIKCPWLQSGLPRYITICDISRYFLYIAICDVSRYFLYIAICDITRYFLYISRYAIYRDIFLLISRYKRTWIYGDRRKNRRRKSEIYEQSFSIMLGHTCTYIRIQLRCCVHIYCKLSAPIEIQPPVLVCKRVTANAYNKSPYYTDMYYFLKYCHGSVHGYGDNIVKHESFFFDVEDEWSHKIIM